MTSKEKIKKIDLIKAPLLKLGKAAIQNKFLDYLFAGVGITATTASVPISIPLITGLFVAYAGINFFEGKEKATKQKIITDEFEKRLDEISIYLTR